MLGLLRSRQSRHTQRLVWLCILYSPVASTRGHWQLVQKRRLGSWFMVWFLPPCHFEEG